MDDLTLEEQNKILIEALTWYANADNYWENPIPLELKLDSRTLHIAHESHEATEVIKDRGNKARVALMLI